MTQQGRRTRQEFAPRAAGIAVALVLAAAGGRAPARASTLPRTAQVARAVSVNDTGHLHLLHAAGEILTEEGAVSGTLPGITKVRLRVGATVRAEFMIRVRGGGSITGTGRATLHSSGRYSSFAGTLAVSGGTGRYAHAHGTGKLYGTIERRYDNVTVQTREGTLDY